MRLTRFLFLAFLMAAVWLTLTGASGSADLAITIATVVLMILAPFLPLAQLHFKDGQIVIASMVLALVVALAAQILSGELTALDWNNVSGLGLEFGKLWAIQQAVFQLFKDSGKLGPLLTSKPLLVAPQPPTADVPASPDPPPPPAPA